MIDHIGRVVLALFDQQLAQLDDFKADQHNGTEPRPDTDGSSQERKGRCDFGVAAVLLSRTREGTKGERGAYVRVAQLNCNWRAHCMTPFTFFFLLFGLWSSIHLIHRFRLSSNNSRNLLPTSSTTRRRKATTVTLTGPYLRVESTAFNSRHEILAQWFSRNRISRAATTLRVIFDSGIVIALLGMVIALAVLLWTFIQLARKSIADLVPVSAGVVPHVKRAYDSTYALPTVTQRTATDIPVQLLVRRTFSSLIPTANVCTHLPTNSDTRSHASTLSFPCAHKRAVLLASNTRSRACTLCRIVRPEYPASPSLTTDVSDRDGVPLQSLGASLTLLLPAAFVAFPTNTLTALTPRVRARIAAAGPLFSALLYLLLLLPLGGPFIPFGYSDISSNGLLVSSVTPGSPLANHLPPGTLLTALDDFPLSNAKENSWSDYLTGPHSLVSKEPAMCLDSAWFYSGELSRGPIRFSLMTYLRTDHSHGCCATPPPGPGSEACLIPLRSDETPRCVEASGLLVPTEIEVTRCEWSCTDGQTCARLRGGEQFLRISVQSVDQESSTRVVLWRGKPEEIYDDGMITVFVQPGCFIIIVDLVDVTRWRPRWPILPLWLPNFITEIIMCVCR